MRDDSTAGPPSSDDWKTPSQPRLIGHFRDASDYDVAISVDRGDVIIRHRGHDMRLSADAREHFQRLYMQAEREAEAWAALIWCEAPGECANGPAAHIWRISCADEDEPAEREAGTWTAQNPPGDADVVTAEIWCGNPGECVNGPDGHLWADGSCREKQTPVSDPCTFAATFTDRDNIPCAWPRGHTGLHSWMPVP